MIALPSALITGALLDVPSPTRRLSLDLASQVVSACATSPDCWTVTDLHRNSFEIDTPDRNTVETYTAVHYLPVMTDRINPAAIVWAKFKDRFFTLHAANALDFTFTADCQTTMLWLAKAGLTPVDFDAVIGLDHVILVSPESGEIMISNHDGEVTVTNFKISAEHRQLIWENVAALGWIRREDGVYLNPKHNIPWIRRSLAAQH